jgi:nitroreductase
MDEKTKAFFQVILDRRSVRKYKPDHISEEDIRLIMESGRQAPSGENAQPWRFIIVKDQKNKDFLSYIGKNASGRRFTGEFLSKQMQKRFEGLEDPEKRRKSFETLTSGNVSAFVNEADFNILVLGRKDVWDAPFDTSAAIENMHLTVTSLGLGACWLCAPCIDIRDEKKMKDYFKIPEELKLFAIVSVGVPERIAKPRPRIPLHQLVYNEMFGTPYYKEEPEGGKQ